MNVAIAYNRSVRCYQAVDPAGQVQADFPAGPQGKRAAERWLLGQQNPAALDLADRLARAYPLLADRAFRAALIVGAGGVELGICSAEIRSQTDADLTYLVHLEPVACSCEDYAKGLAGEPHGAPVVTGFPCCKHILAALMTEKLNAPPPEPIPAEAWDRYYQERDQFAAQLAAAQAGVSVLF